MQLPTNSVHFFSWLFSWTFFFSFFYVNVSFIATFQVTLDITWAVLSWKNEFSLELHQPFWLPKHRHWHILQPTGKRAYYWKLKLMLRVSKGCLPICEESKKQILKWVKFAIGFLACEQAPWTAWQNIQNVAFLFFTRSENVRVNYSTISCKSDLI